MALYDDAWLFPVIIFVHSIFYPMAQYWAEDKFCVWTDDIESYIQRVQGNNCKTACNEVKFTLNFYDVFTQQDQMPYVWTFVLVSFLYKLPKLVSNCLQLSNQPPPVQSSQPAGWFAWVDLVRTGCTNFIAHYVEQGSPIVWHIFVCIVYGIVICNIYHGQKQSLDLLVQSQRGIRDVWCCDPNTYECEETWTQYGVETRETKRHADPECNWEGEFGRCAGKFALGVGQIGVDAVHDYLQHEKNMRNVHYDIKVQEQRNQQWTMKYWWVMPILMLLLGTLGYPLEWICNCIRCAFVCMTGVPPMLPQGSGPPSFLTNGAASLVLPPGSRPPLLLTNGAAHPAHEPGQTGSSWLPIGSGFQHNGQQQTAVRLNGQQQPNGQQQTAQPNGQQQPALVQSGSNALDTLHSEEQVQGNRHTVRMAEITHAINNAVRERELAEADKTLKRLLDGNEEEWQKHKKPRVSVSQQASQHTNQSSKTCIMCGTTHNRKCDTCSGKCTKDKTAKAKALQVKSPIHKKS